MPLTREVQVLVTSPGETLEGKITIDASGGLPIRETILDAENEKVINFPLDVSALQMIFVKVDADGPVDVRFNVGEDGLLVSFTPAAPFFVWFAGSNLTNPFLELGGDLDAIQVTKELEVGAAVITVETLLDSTP